MTKVLFSRFLKLSSRTPSLVKTAQGQIDQSLQRTQGQLGLQQSRTLARSLTWILIGCSFFGASWLTFAQTDEVVVTQGKLEPIDEVKTIQVPIGGVLEEILVKEGDQVVKGQTLLRLNKEVALTQRDSLGKSKAAKERQLALKEDEITNYLRLNSEKARYSRKNLELEENIYKRLLVLQLQGASSELQLLSQKAKVEEIQSNLINLSIERIRDTLLLKQEIQKLKSEIAELASRLVESSVNLRYQEIKSPVDGTVFDLKPTGLGFVAQGSESVMKVVPLNKLKAKVEIPSSKIGFVKVGRPVEISIDSFPASDYGVLKGSVKRIGSDALAPDQMNATYRYPAEIQLETQVLSPRKGISLPLQVGMSVTANVKLRKVSYLDLLLGQLRDKAESLRRI